MIELEEERTGEKHLGPWILGTVPHSVPILVRSVQRLKLDE